MRTLFRALTSATLLTSLTTCSWVTWSGWLCWTGELDLIKRKSSWGPHFQCVWLPDSAWQAADCDDLLCHFLPRIFWPSALSLNGGKYRTIFSPFVLLIFENVFQFWSRFIWESSCEIRDVKCLSSVYPRISFLYKISFYSEFWMLQVVNMNLYSIYTPILVITVGTFLIARWKLLIFIFKIEKLNLPIL